MNVLISGSSGLIGSALVRALEDGGHSVGRLVRAGAHDAAAPPGSPGALPAASVQPSSVPSPGPQTRIVSWDPDRDYIDRAALEGFDAIVHLAGESIQGRWSARKRRRILDSRVRGTGLLCDALASLRRPPQVLASASAMGFYGHRGDEVLAEDAPSGQGFLADVCRQWEVATAPAERAGVRVAHLRFGMVLAGEGGALPPMARAARLLAGGRVGNGRQYWSWIALADAVAAVQHVLADKSVHGPVNVAAPEATRCGEFMRTLRRILGRPLGVPMPAWLARVSLGRMADELMLSSTRLLPRKLIAAGFCFDYPSLESALRAELGLE